jgi:CHAD domain-containing protein
MVRDKDSRSAARRARPIKRVARRIVRERTRKIIKTCRKMEQLDAPERHKLRIAVKKLRYATGFFACLFNHPKTKKARKYFEKELKALQSALGKLNDMFASAAWAEVCSLKLVRDRNVSRRRHLRSES